MKEDAYRGLFLLCTYIHGSKTLSLLPVGVSPRVHPSESNFLRNQASKCGCNSNIWCACPWFTVWKWLRFLPDTVFNLHVYLKSVYRYCNMLMCIKQGFECSFSMPSIHPAATMLDSKGIKWVVFLSFSWCITQLTSTDRWPHHKTRVNSLW